MTPSEGSGLALVVGGGSGIGAALVEAYRGVGTRVVVWDVAGEHDVRCDVTDPQSVEAAMSLTAARWAVPTWTTVTAGVGHSGSLVDVPVEEWDRVMATNTRGPWLVLRTVARAMMESGRTGSMVATSSISAHLVDRGMGVYCTSKAALSMLVQVAAYEWAERGIRVNGVGPGVTRTPMLGQAPVDSGWLKEVSGRTPLGRLGRAVDIAETIMALHSLAWVTGQIVDCDGGLSLSSPIDSFSHGAPPP